MRARRHIEGAGGRRICSLAAAVSGVAFLVACGNPTQPTADCVGVSPETLQVIQEGVTTDAELRNGKIVSGAEPPYSFVSAELHLRSDDPHHSGDIATWAIDDTNGPDDTAVLAVDVVARDQSSWPAAPFNVTEHGAIESRACTDLSRGKTPAQVECERDANNAAIQLPDGKKCGDL